MDKLLKHFGSLTAIALACGASPQAVGKWMRKGIPLDRCPQLEQASGGAIKCDELRPDVIWIRSRGKVTAYRVAVKKAA